MRISVNLATRPFVELKPFFARLRLIMAALVLLAVGLGVALHMQNVKLAAADAQMRDLQTQTDAARQEKTRNESRMRQPTNAAVLERAHFLNRLFLAKSFSWTAVMMDLENVLPLGVQVTAIEPQITADGDVIIRLRVAGERDRAVQLVRNLEHSRRFLQPRLSGESAQAKDTNGQSGTNRGPNAVVVPPSAVEFEILANYNPVPPGGPYTVAKSPRQRSAVSMTPHHRQAARPAATRGQYPPDGVVLKPYVPPVRPSTAPGGVR